MKTIALKKISLLLVLSCAEMLHPMAPDDSDKQNLKRTTQDPYPQSLKRQRFAPLEEQEVVQAAAAAAGEEIAPSLHRVIEDGNNELALALIAGGTDVNARNEDEETPLHVAVRAKNLFIVQHLLAAGADPNLRPSPLHNSVLHDAVANAEITQALLQAGANAQVTNSSDATPLHFAALAGGARSIPLLVAAGAHINAPDSQLRTPLHWAARETDSTAELMCLIACASNIHLRDNRGRTALFYTAQNSDSRPTRILISAGAEININDQENISPLAVAIHRRNIETVRFFIEAGAIVIGSPITTATRTNYLDETTRLIFSTPTMATRAAQITRVNQEIVQLLLSSPTMTTHAAEAVIANPIVPREVKVLFSLFLIVRTSPIARTSSPAYCTTTPTAHAATTAATAVGRSYITGLPQDLCEALKTGDPRACDLLRHYLRRGFDINTRGAHNETLLHRAVERNNILVIQILVEHPEIDLAAQDNLGNTPIILAKSEEARALITEALAERTKHSRKGLPSDLCQAVVSDDPHAILLLQSYIARGLHVNTRGVQRETLLHLAAARNNLAVVQALLEQPGINLTAKDDEGDRALDLTKSIEIKSLILATIKQHRPADFLEGLEFYLDELEF